jgi:hypothetical protein
MAEAPDSGAREGDSHDQVDDPEGSSPQSRDAPQARGDTTHDHA